MFKFDMPTCAKVMYESKADAKRDADRKAGFNKVYKCPDCGNFHLTTKRHPKRRKKFN